MTIVHNQNASTTKPETMEKNKRRLLVVYILTYSRNHQKLLSSSVASRLLTLSHSPIHRSWVALHRPRWGERDFDVPDKGQFGWFPVRQCHMILSWSGPGSRALCLAWPEPWKSGFPSFSCGLCEWDGSAAIVVWFSGLSAGSNDGGFDVQC